MFRLALALGRTVGELQRSITAAELTEWMGFYLLEPFGQSRIDDGFRGMQSLIFNTNRGKGVPARHPDDFMPVWKPPAPPREEADVDAIAAFFERRVAKGSKP